MGTEPLVEHFRMFGHYNQIVNARLYSACGELDDRERHSLKRRRPFPGWPRCRVQGDPP